VENIIIRNVKKEDLWAVSSIAVEGWKSAYRGIIDDELLDSLKIEDNYNKRLKDYKENGFIVAEINNDVVGFCRYTINNLFSQDMKDIDCELCALYVKPNLKRQGIGTALFQYVIQEQKKNENQSMILWCLKENYNSRSFYEKMGGILYSETETQKGGKKYIEVGYKFDLDSI
jgi:ribosomal protein S18 acetylase RimI-like enzyme